MVESSLFQEAELLPFHNVRIILSASHNTSYNISALCIYQYVPSIKTQGLIYANRASPQQTDSDSAFTPGQAHPACLVPRRCPWSLETPRLPSLPSSAACTGVFLVCEGPAAQDSFAVSQGPSPQPQPRGSLSF